MSGVRNWSQVGLMDTRLFMAPVQCQLPTLNISQPTSFFLFPSLPSPFSASCTIFWQDSEGLYYKGIFWKRMKFPCGREMSTVKFNDLSQKDAFFSGVWAVRPVMMHFDALFSSSAKEHKGIFQGQVEHPTLSKHYDNLTLFFFQCCFWNQTSFWTVHFQEHTPSTHPQQGAISLLLSPIAAIMTDNISVIKHWKHDLLSLKAEPICVNFYNIPHLRFMLYLFIFIFTQGFWGFTHFSLTESLTWAVCLAEDTTWQVESWFNKLVALCPFIHNSQVCRLKCFSNIFRLRILCGYLNRALKLDTAAHSDTGQHLRYGAIHFLILDECIALMFILAESS